MSVTTLFPDTEPAPGSPPPINHPMDPRRSEDITPVFAAVLAWAIGLPPITEPAIVSLTVASGSVYAGLSSDPFHNQFIGDWDDLERNLRAWGAAAGASPDTINAVVAKAREAR